MACPHMHLFKLGALHGDDMHCWCVSVGPKSCRNWSMTSTVDVQTHSCGARLLLCRCHGSLSAPSSPPHLTSSSLPARLALCIYCGVLCRSNMHTNGQWLWLVINLLVTAIMVLFLRRLLKLQLTDRAARSHEYIRSWPNRMAPKCSPSASCTSGDPK